MEVGNIKVKIGADSGELTSGLNKASQQITHFAATVKKGSNEATQAMTNLGRVVQDAPYGFMGIANNINPLLESFQRLKVETGSTKAALQQLGGSLMGAGGLSFAVSIASSLMVMFAGKFFETGAKAKAAKEKIDEYKKAVEESFKDAAKEATQVQSLIAVLQSELSTRSRKLDALNDLKKINPEIFSQLKLEGETVVGLDNAYKAYIASLKTVIAAKIKQQQLEKITQQILEKEGATLTKSEKMFAETMKTITKRFQGADIAAKKEKETQTGLNALYRDQAALIKDLQELQSGVDVSLPKAAKDTKTYIDVIAELRKEVAGLHAQYKNGFISSVQLDQKVIDAYQKAVGQLAEMKAPPLIISEIAFEVTPEQLREAMRKLGEFVAKEMKEDPMEVPLEPKPVIEMTAAQATLANLGKKFLNEMDLREGKSFGIDLGAGISITQFKEKLEEAKKSFAAFKGSLSQMMTDLKAKLISSVAEGIGNALATGNIKGLFSGIFQTLAQGLKQMGEAMIQYGAGIIILKKAIKNPYLAIAAGVGLVALSSVLQAKVPKFAKGGMVTGPTLSMLGDNPSGKEAIIPFERMGEFMSTIGGKGGREVFIAENRIEGTTLVTWYRRAVAQDGRFH